MDFEPIGLRGPQEYHFITGLPRAGTTLLAAILRQNWRHWASFSSPLGPVVQNLLYGMCPADESHILMTEGVREHMVRSAIVAYHETTNKREVVFDTNRSWAARAPLLFKLFPRAKMICMLRPYDEIVESFERLYREHPAEISKIYNMQAGATVYDRVSYILSPTAVLGYAVNATNELWSGPFAPWVLFVQYADLCNAPDATMRRIHEFCGLPPFDYNFHKIEQLPEAAAFDQSLGTPGLHEVGRIVRPHAYKRQMPDNVYPLMIEPFWLKK